MEYGSVVGLLIVIAVFLIVFLVYLLTTGEYRLGRWREARMAIQQEADQREPKTKNANRTALLACLLKGPVAVASAIIALICLPIVRYKRHRQEAERAKQEAVERRQREAAEWRQQAIERAERLAIERQQKEARRAKKAALLAQQRKRQQYWESLGGIPFERELGKLFRAHGYGVKSTPTSGDQGVDLILTKSGKITVVQCKAHKSPVGVSVVRDLFGSMHHFKADSAILASTGGFTNGVVKFARGKPIRLIDSQHIARMAEESGDRMQDITESPPVCPKDGCGRTMVVRNGRRGKFWGCPRYPTCRGTRDFNEFQSVGSSVPIPDEDSQRLF